MSKDKGKSADGPPLFNGPERSVYKRKVLSESESRGNVRLLEEALLDCCGGKADTWIGTKKLAWMTRTSIRSIPRLLNQLESGGKWVVVDDSRVTSRRRVIDCSHPNHGKTLEALRSSPHVKFDRCRSNPAAIARTKGLAIPEPSDNGHSRVPNCHPQGCQTATLEGAKLSPKPLNTVPEPENLNLGEFDVNPDASACAPLACEGPPPEPQPQPQPVVERIDDGTRERISSLKGNGETVRPPCPRCGRPQETAGGGRFMSCFRPGCEGNVPIVAAVQAPPASTLAVMADALDVQAGQSLQSDPRPSGAVRCLLPEQELAIIRLAKSLGHGSTEGEISLGAFKASREAGDGHSLLWWKRVFQLTAVGIIPPSVFSGISSPGTRNSVAVLADRIKKIEPDLWRDGLPGTRGKRLNEALRVPANKARYNGCRQV